MGHEDRRRRRRESSFGGAADPDVALSAAAETLAEGRLAVVHSPEEGFGAVVGLAECTTAGTINFMVREARGIVTLALPAERCAGLGLELMEQANTPAGGPAYATSIEARTGITTGISAADRARTIRVAADPDSGPDDLIMPGHVLPQRARPRGVFERPAMAEATVELARLAGGSGAAALCQVMDDEGRMAGSARLEAFCRSRELPLVSVPEIVAAVVRRTPLLERISEAPLSTELGSFRAIGYRSVAEGRDYVALTYGDLQGSNDVIVGMHRACLFGEVFRSVDCDCGERLKRTMSEIVAAGAGVLVYLRASDTSVNVGPCPGQDSLDAAADAAKLSAAAWILGKLGVSSARLADRAPSALSSLPAFSTAAGF